MMNLRRFSDPYQSRRVVIEVSLTVDKGVFVVRDQGPGFDPYSLPDPTAAQQIERCSGRGLLLIRTFMDEISFNPSGNELTLTKVRAGAPIPATA
jgi:anti-sigma regulatory factor (Ser/Thr protein kinase)